MGTKIYFSLWILGIIAAGIFYWTGNLTPVMKVLFGFLTFGTLFMGFLSMIPLTVFHKESTRH